MRRTLEVARIYPTHQMAIDGFKFYEEEWSGQPSLVFKRSNLTIEGQGIRNRFMAIINIEILRGLQLDKVVVHEEIKLSEAEAGMLKSQLMMSKVGAPIGKM